MKNINTETLTIALAKGRLADGAVSLLERCGLDCSPLREDTRKLVLYDKTGAYRFIFVKPSDVPVYVERGAADAGFTGKDTLMEADGDVCELLDIKAGKCRLCIAGFPEKPRIVTPGRLTVATKYANLARRLFAEKNITADIITLNGSVELGPVIGLSDVILDIVESGKTLEANGLVVLEEICGISARFIANKVSLKTRQNQIMSLKEKMEKIVNGAR